MRKRQDPSARFFAKTQPEPNSGCLLWTAAVYPTGYGMFNVHGHNSSPLKAHRVAWEAANGPIPAGLSVLHKCDTPLCVNVEHLFLGTQADNVADMRAKKRNARGEAHGRHKLTDAQASEVRAVYANDNGETYKSVGRMFGVTPSCVGLIVRGERRLA